MVKKIALAFRNILRYREINSINIIGLATGLMAVLLIFQYIRFEESYDKFFGNADNIYRLVFYRHYQTGLDKSVGNNYYVGEIAASAIPEIENFCRCKKASLFFETGDQIYREDRVLFADSTFLKIFSHRIISGDPRSLLDNPGTVVLTETIAHKYFGNEDPLGKYINVVNPGRKPLMITGVIGDVPANTHLHFDMIIPLSTITDKSYCYGCNNTNVYFLLKNGADLASVEAGITDLGKKNFSSRGVELDFPIEYQLQPVTDIHLHSNYRSELEPNGNSRYITILLMIALLILISAGLNYVSLYKSITLRRIKGVGIRMVNGASPFNIISEFVTETLLTGMISFVLAILMLYFLFPLLSWYLDFSFGVETVTSFSVWIFPFTILVAVSIITGLLTSMKVIKFSPLVFLKNELVLREKKLPGRLLLTGQFTIAIFLISSTIVAIRQIGFMKNDAMTMEMDQTLVVKTPGSREFNAAQVSFRESIMKIPEIEKSTFSTISPGENNNWVKGGIALKQEPNLGYQLFQMDVSPDFFDFFTVRLVEGRQFFKDETNWEEGPKHIILNKEAAMSFSKPNIKDLIGQVLYDSETKKDIGEIVGIIDGYFQNSLDQRVKPTIFNCDKIGTYSFIRIKASDAANAISKIKSEFNRHFKGQYFEYFFLDEFFNSQYRSHIQLYKCFTLFSLMAVIITILSLYGLATLSSGARTKEIGIRKLNGSGISEIIFMLNREILILVIISLFIATPVTWFLMNRWLNNFAYRVELSWWIFALSGVLSILIVVVSISRQSLKAAMMNPSEALRYE